MSEEVVIEGFAGIVMVTVALCLASATDFAVMVAVVEFAVAAGAVYVTEVLVFAERPPGPERPHDTPAAPLSFVTEADTVTLFDPSTVVELAVTATEIGRELPPQPDTTITAAMKAIAHAMRIGCRRNAKSINGPVRALF